MPAWAIVLAERLGKWLLSWVYRKYKEKHRNKSSSQIGLLPCPFCGDIDADVISEDYEGFRYRVIRCSNCSARGAEADDGLGAVHGWNDRTKQKEVVV